MFYTVTLIVVIFTINTAQSRIHLKPIERLKRAPIFVCPSVPHCQCNQVFTRNELICNNFTSFEQLDFKDNYNQYEKIVIHPVDALDLDGTLDLTGIIATSQTEIELRKIKRFYFNVNPFKKLRMQTSRKFATLVIAQSTLVFLNDEAKPIDCEYKKLFDEAVSSDRVTMFSQMNKLVFENVDFPQPICPFLFHGINLKNAEIVAPTDGGFEFTSISDEQSMDCKIDYFYLKNVRFDTLDSVKVLSRHLLSKTIKIYIKNTAIGHIADNTFESFKALKELHFENVDMKKIFSAGTGWFASLNSDKNFDLTDTNEIINGLRGSFVKVLLTQTDYTFPNEDFCLFKNFPFNKLVLVFPSARAECSCTLLWLMRLSKYYSYAPLNDFDFRFSGNVDYCTKECRCNPDEAMRWCMESSKPSDGELAMHCKLTTIAAKTTKIVPTTALVPSTAVVKPATNDETSREAIIGLTSMEKSTPSDEKVSNTNDHHQILDCPDKCECNSKIDSSYDLLCKNFKSFKELNFSSAKTRFNRVDLKPIEDIELDDTFGFAGLQMTNDVIVTISNVKRFQSNLNPIKNTKKLIIEDSTLEFRSSTDNKPLCDSETARMNFFSYSNNVQLVNVKLTESLCPLIFANTKLDKLEIQVLPGNLEFLSLKPHQQPLNSVIRSFTLKNAKIEVLDDVSVLNRDVFLNTKTIRIEDTSVKRVHNRTFEHFKELNNVEFVNVKGIFESGNDKEWISSLNYDLKVNLTNSKMVNERIENKEYVSLVLRQNDYTFPDEDFCDFIFYPFDQLVFMSIEPKPECTCTLRWISKYDSLFTDEPICKETVTISKSECDFENWLLKCKTNTKSVKKSERLSNSAITGIIFAVLFIIATIAIICALFVRSRRQLATNTSSFTSFDDFKMSSVNSGVKKLS